jgi:hypothetical protein
MAKKQIDSKVAAQSESKTGPWKVLENIVSDVVSFYGSAFTSAANLALPYWLVKDVEHVKFLAAISSILLALKGIEVFNDPTQIIALPAVLAVVLSSFAIGWIFYVFVPTPALPERDELSGRRNQSNIACMFLLISLLAVVLHEILLECGIGPLFDPSDPPFGLPPIENSVLRAMMNYASSVIATILSILLIILKQKIFDIKRSPNWRMVGSIRAIGPLALAYLIPVAFVVYHLTL